MTTQQLRKQIIKYCNNILEVKATKSKIIKVGGNELLLFYIDKKYYKKQNIMLIVNLNGTDEITPFNNGQYDLIRTFEGMEEIYFNNILKEYIATPINDRKRKVTTTKTIH